MTWRANWISETGFGGIVKVDSLQEIDDDGTTDAGGRTWQLRWDNVADEWSPATPPTSVVPFHQIQGQLAAVNGWQSIFTSPRLVTPDGACTIYLSPFANVELPSIGPRIAVLGDDLVQRLNDSAYNTTYEQGYVQGRLNAVGVQAEVEGQAGRRLTNAVDTPELMVADGYVLDEFRGLLEHDIDGFVVALGMNDALYVAAGGASESARLAEVKNKLTTVLSEIGSRSACTQLFTMPENSSSLHARYQWAAQQLNQHLRAVAALGGPDSTSELVDFGAQAVGQPWFAADGVHLSATGTTVYADTIARAARRCSDSAILYGAAGTLNEGPLADRTSLPTGQRYRGVAVTDWDEVPGKRLYAETVTGDGTVVVGRMSQIGPITATGDSMSLSAFSPDEGTFANIKVKTDRGRESVYLDGSGGPNTVPNGMDVADVDAIDGGNAVVFIGGSPSFKPGQSLEQDGLFPMVGILTKDTSGAWRVAEGTGWRNSWSSRELYDATVDDDPFNGAALGDQACPIGGSGVRECLGMTEIDVWPGANGSCDIAVAQYFGMKEGLPAGEITRSGQVMVLHVDRDPTTSGRYKVAVKAVYEIPEVADPAHTGYKLGVNSREVQVDPTSTANDKRFVLASDVYYCQRVTASQPPCPVGPAPGGIVELKYDPNQPWQSRIQPVSAPILTGEARASGTLFTNLATLHYDHQGNLWSSVHDRPNGQGIIVYAKTTSGRKLSNGTCPFDPSQLANYVYSSPAYPNAPATWGSVCTPDYKITAPRAMGWIRQLEENPVTHDIVATTTMNSATSTPPGTIIVIRPSGSGTGMSFQVGSIADALAGKTPAANWPCPSDPSTNCGHSVETDGLAVDATGRAWINVGHSQDNPPDSRMDLMHNWLLSFDTSRLLGREPLRLKVTTGQDTVIHAELRTSIETTAVIPGTAAGKDFDSLASMARCTTCEDPLTGITSGFTLADETGGGVAANVTARYRVVVPKAGSYQVKYQARDASTSTPATIRLTANGTSTDTTVSSTTMGPVTGPTLTFAAPGTYTITLTAPTAADAGWLLDYMTFKRL